MKNNEGIWRLEYWEPLIHEDLDEQNDLTDDQFLKLFFGKYENCSNLDRVRKKPHLVIAVKSS